MFIEINAELVNSPNYKPITRQKPALPDADDWNNKPGKLALLER